MTSDHRDLSISVLLLWLLTWTQLFMLGWWTLYGLSHSQSLSFLKAYFCKVDIKYYFKWSSKPKYNYCLLLSMLVKWRYPLVFLTTWGFWGRVSWSPALPQPHYEAKHDLEFLPFLSAPPGSTEMQITGAEVRPKALLIPGRLSSWAAPLVYSLMLAQCYLWVFKKL